MGDFLDMVSHCVDSIIQEQFAGDEKYDEEAEEYLLGPLDPNVPVEYATVDSGLYDDEMPLPPETAATDVAIPSLKQYPQLGLNYDPKDEAIFHLPEDEYEQIPLEAFETDEEEVQEDNPFRVVGYDAEVDDLLSSTEGCLVIIMAYYWKRALSQAKLQEVMQEITAEQAENSDVGGDSDADDDFREEMSISTTRSSTASSPLVSPTSSGVATPEPRAKRKRTNIDLNIPSTSKQSFEEDYSSDDSLADKTYQPDDPQLFQAPLLQSDNDDEQPEELQNISNDFRVKNT
ncbi:hypothetical protein RN001_008842 [Aquatica leii]|uniref:Uncharacterized protein n=1 Tax=Aquatica leii TaxID=1421715 RepID=A0AAN7S9W4_9COLE|nr:hypothetical protein RN001_008842 [Aquatica leii]